MTPPQHLLSTARMAEGESKRESAEVETPEDPLVQYLVVRKVGSFVEWHRWEISRD